MTTHCDTCDHVHPDTRKGPSHSWLCTRFPRLPGQGGFLTGEVWEKDPPFMYCRGINGGVCPMWKARRDGQMEII